MSTITLPNIRVSSDLTIRLKLKDGGVAIDWSTLQNIRVSLYADDQRSMASRCNVSIDEEDSTILVCQYAANKMQYLGVNRVIVQCKYMGEVKTYDKPAFTFVRWTSDQEGEQITIDDPDVDVEISVEDVSSSILQEAVDAAFDAADRANDAAAAAEHMVDIHTGPEGKSAYEVAVEEGYTGTEEEWLASLKGDTGETPDISIGTVTTVAPGTPASASMTGTPEEPVLNLSIPQGVVGATPNFTVGTVTTGEPGSSVIVTITGTPEAPVLNLTIPQGMQGNTGSSVDYPYELVNNLTTNDATKGLSAAQGVVLDGKVSQLEAKVTDLSLDVSGMEEVTGIRRSFNSSILTTGRFINRTNGVQSNSPYRSCTDFIEVKPGAKVKFNVLGGSGTLESGYALYNQSKTFVSGGGSTSSASATTENFTIPSGVYFIRVSFFDSSKADFSTFFFDYEEDGAFGVLVENVNELRQDVSDLDEQINGGESETVSAPRIADSYWSGSAFTGSSVPTSPTSVPGSTDGIYCDRLDVSEGDKYKIYGNGNYSYLPLFVILSASGTVLEKYLGDNREDGVLRVMPQGARYLYVNMFGYDSTRDKIVKYVSTPGLKDEVDDLKDEVDEIVSANPVIIQKYTGNKSFAGHLPIQRIGSTDYCVIIMYGQSLSTGAETPASWLDTPNPNCYKLGETIWDYRDYWNLGLKPLSTGLISRVRTDGVFEGVQQDPVVSAVNAFANLYQMERPYANTKFIAVSLGVGGYTLAQLDTEERYPNCTHHILDTKLGTFLEKVKAIADAENKTISVGAIFWNQGEADYGEGDTGRRYIGKTYEEWLSLASAQAAITPYNMAMDGSKDAYKQGLKYLRDDMYSIILTKFPDQTARPAFLTYGVCGTYINNAFMTINMGMHEATEEELDMFEVGPTYMTPDYNGGHLSMNGYRWYGEYCAKALYNIAVKNISFRPLRPKTFTIVDNKIYIYFDGCTYSLSLDTATVGDNYKNYGFIIRTGTEQELDAADVNHTNSGQPGVIKEISNIEVNDNCVILTCAEQLAEYVEVIYAGMGEFGFIGKNQGAGNLRDNDDWAALYSYKDDSLDHGSWASSRWSKAVATESEKETLDEWQEGQTYASGDKCLLYAIESTEPYTITSLQDNNNRPPFSLVSHRPDIVGKLYPMQNWCMPFYKRLENN